MTAGDEEDYPPPLPRYARPPGDEPEDDMDDQSRGAEPARRRPQSRSGPDDGSVAGDVDPYRTTPPLATGAGGQRSTFESSGPSRPRRRPMPSELARPRVPALPPAFPARRADGKFSDSPEFGGVPRGSVGDPAFHDGREPRRGESADRRSWTDGRQSNMFPSGERAPIRTGPIPLIVAALVLVVVAGVFGWQARSTRGAQEVTIGGTDDTETSTSLAPAETVPLSPANLPSADVNGLIGLELPLIDVYTGTGSTGSVELYLNALTGQVCHVFDAGVMTSRFQAYIHEAEFPREGPIVVDLGEVANAVPLCVNSSPIDLARALGNGDGFYVAAHSEDQQIVLRAQLSAAMVAFDNRDPELIAMQDDVQASPDTTDGVGDDLFDDTDEGAYLIVESNRVTFEGMVPDRSTADRLRSAFIALSGTGVEVIDNLQVQAGAAAPSGRVIVADALLFDSGQVQISGDPVVLRTLADVMVVNPTWSMTITGHTDDVGEYLYNIELSLRRASALRDRLSQLGVPPERVRIQGAGPEQPIAENSTEEGRAENRRIEITIDS